MGVRLTLKDRGRLGHVKNLLALVQLKQSVRQFARCVVEPEGLFVATQSACRSVRVDVFLASDELLEDFVIGGEDAFGGVFGFPVAATVEALSEGGHVSVDGEFLAVQSEMEDFKFATKLRLVDNLADNLGVGHSQSQFPSLVTMNADLLLFVLHELANTVASSGSVDCLVKVQLLPADGEVQLRFKCADAASGMDAEIAVPGRSVKVEGDAVELDVKVWVLLSLVRLLQQIGTALVRVQLSTQAIRIQHKPIMDSTSGCVFTLLSAGL